MTIAFDISQQGNIVGRKNKIINGNFDIWQRGTSQTSSGYGSADRWNNNHNTSTKVHSQQAFTLGQTEVPGNPKYYSRTVVTSNAGTNSSVTINQMIEDVRTFSGETITLSFWAKADATKDIAIEFLQYFGAGGSPSAQINEIEVTTFNLTTDWQKFTATVSLPSILGKTLGTDGNSILKLKYWFDAGSDYDARSNSLGLQSGTFDIAQVQLEAGSVATDFEQRLPGEELALCQRYYQKSDGTSIWTGDVTNAALSYYDTTSFSVHMRADPTCTTVKTNANSFANTLIVNITRTDRRKICVSCVPSATAARAYFDWTWTADAEL